jgi:hypothetical protein
MADHQSHDGAEDVQRFRTTNGRVVGLLGLVMCLVAAAAFVVYEPPHVAVPGVIGCAFAAGLVWLALLRPSVAASSTELHLRTVFESVTIPLASVETVVVRRYLLVRSGGRKYICPAISRPLRRTVRSEMRWGGQQFMQPGLSEERLSGGRLQTEVKDQGLAYPDFVEQRIAALAANDRARRGIEERSEAEYELGGQVVRRPAWLELGVLAVLAVAFVVSLLVL